MLGLAPWLIAVVVTLVVALMYHSSNREDWQEYEQAHRDAVDAQ